MVEGAGYFLKNRMAYYYLDPKETRSRRGNRTCHAISPSLALKGEIEFGMSSGPGGSGGNQR